MFAQHRPKRSVDFFELSVSHAYILNEVFSNLVYMLDESNKAKNTKYFEPVLNIFKVLR